jgi:hypothetical protein
MNIQIVFRRLVASLLFLPLLTPAFAGYGDTTHIRSINSLTSAIHHTTNDIGSHTRSFDELDKYIASQHFFIDQNNFGFTNEFFEEFNRTDGSIEEDRLKAKATLGEIEANNSYVDYLGPEDINKLPIGLKKRVGNTDVTIAVSSAVFTPTYAKLTVFARVKIPQSPKEIFFGVKDLQLSYKGGIIGNAKLVLLGDLAIPINGNNAALVLKGGDMNISTGQIGEKTYVTIDCNGFRELGITADVQFPRSLIVPVNASGEVVSGNVTANIYNLRISDWNDIITTVNFDKSFQLNGLKGIVFNITTAGFDLSDIHNNPDIVYPQGYQQKYLQAENLNTWRGVYVKNLSVSLPKAFQDKQNANQLVTFGVNDLLIDNNGISGRFYAENILPITKGNASGWKFSVDSLRLAIEANHLLRAGFGGKIGLPVNNDYDTANKGKFLAYSAIITASADYVCKVSTMNAIDFDIWKAKVILKPNSYIQLTGNPDGFRPEAMLHGSIGVHIKSTDGNPRSDTSASVATFKGIEFTALHLQTQAPYITAQYFGYKGELKFGNFPVSLSDIALKNLPNDELALALSLKINLNDELDFTGSTRLDIIGKMEANQGIQSWKYDRLKIEEIAIAANVSSAFTLDGKVRFMDNDPVFGDGFSGYINAEFRKGFPNSVKVNVNATFGRSSFRYWYVDGKVDLGTGIGTPVKLQGFGGGAYYKMKKQGYDPAFSPTGVKYTPDSTAGLGVKAAILFSVGDKKVANGEASFEMAFNKGGGLRYIGIFGYAKILDQIKVPDGVASFVSGNFKKVEDKLQSLDSSAARELDKLKMTDATKAAKQQAVNVEKPGEQGLSAYIGIQYDFNAKTLHANFDLYINAAGNLLRGIGDDYRAGWAVFHAEPSKWYLHMGTPTDPIGVRFGIGPLSIKTTAYFMAGHDMPAFPSPPQEVISGLRDAGIDYINDISSKDLAGGRGLAFGAAVKVNTGDLRFLIFYANFAAGLGFDVMLKDYGAAHCEGKTERIGINGWYAHGQAYAYLQGELGVRIKIGPFKKKISIIKGGAAALLQAKLPNPTWVGGYLGFHVRILGGLIKGRFNFKFSFGNDCVIVNDDGVADENIQVIEELTPDVNATGVSVIVKPKLKFRIKPEEVMEVAKDDGSGNEYFKAKLESFKLYKNDVEVPAASKYNTEGTELTLTANDVLSSNTVYKVEAIVIFQQNVNGKWVGLSENGVKVEEKKSYTFTTGTAPDTLDYGSLQRLYPFFDQRNFYKDEPNKGVIKLDRRFQEYFAKFAKWKVKVESLEGLEIATNYATTVDDSLFKFALPSNLNTNTTYRLLLLGEGPTDPSADVNKPGLKLTFTTSRFGSLLTKMQSLRMTQPVVGKISSDVIDLEADLENYEGFELYEIAGDMYTEYRPMIQGEIYINGEPYFNEVIKPLLYPTMSDHIVVNGTDVYISETGSRIYGVPPLKAIKPSWYYVNSLQSGRFNDLLQRRMPFVYHPNKYYNLHFLELRRKVIDQILVGHGGLVIDSSQVEAFPENVVNLVNKGFPFMLKGDYKARFTFVQLDGTRGVPSEFTYKNPID